MPMTKAEEISFFMNVDISRLRADTLKKIDVAMRGNGSLNGARSDVQSLLDLCVRLERDIEEIARRRHAMIQEREARNVEQKEGV